MRTGIIGHVSRFLCKKFHTCSGIPEWNTEHLKHKGLHLATNKALNLALYGSCELGGHAQESLPGKDSVTKSEQSELFCQDVYCLRAREV